MGGVLTLDTRAYIAIFKAVPGSDVPKRSGDLFRLQEIRVELLLREGAMAWRRHANLGSSKRLL